MAATEPKGHGQHAGLWVFPDVSVMSRDVTEKTKSSPRPLTMALVVTGILFVLGIVGFVASGAPLAAVAFRFTKSHWRRPLSRVSELFAIAGILNILLFIPLMFLLPSIGNPDAVGGLIEGELAVRRTIWFEAPIGSPHAWDLVGVAGLVVTALFILWLSAMPDMAESRHTATGFRPFHCFLVPYQETVECPESWIGIARCFLLHDVDLHAIRDQFRLCTEPDPGLERFHIPGYIHDH